MVLHRFENGVAFNAYRESVSELVSPLRTSGHYRDLPHQAYEARTTSKHRRVSLAHGLATRLLIDDTPYSQSRVFEAEALHIVSVPLASEIPPAELAALLLPCTVRLNELRHTDDPELGRYIGLIERTVSMAASKLDLYTYAFDRMNRAHYALSDAPGDRRSMTRDEALQQLYLQECGQLVRNVEAALIEQDPMERLLLHAGQPPRKSLSTSVNLQALRIVARAGAEAGVRACRLLDFIAIEAGLPSIPDPEDRRLATSSWFLTSNIMYMRALLLAATVELSARQGDASYLSEVPEIYARVVESHTGATRPGENVALKESHQLDLTRVALHWSFLTAGTHPYTPRELTYGLRPGIPKHLIESDGGRLDHDACSLFLEERNHDVGILDILAHRETYQLLGDRGSFGGHGYYQWLDRNRSRRSLFEDISDSQDDPSRSTRRSTYGLTARAARMVMRTDRYRDAFAGLNLTN